LVEQILINIVVNAIQAVDGKTGARITPASHLDGGGWVAIHVSDSFYPEVLIDIRTDDAHLNLAKVLSGAKY
jgi:phosphoglycerate-specific signal transduction histidine kinase